MASELPRRRRLEPQDASGSTAPPPMVHRPGQALHRQDGDVQGHDDHRPRPGGGPAHGQQLRLPGPLPLLRRHHLPPHHPGLRGPGRRPDGHRHGRARLPVRRRAAASPVATRSARWPWPTPVRTPTAASSSSSAGPTACACRRSTRCSARWSRASSGRRHRGRRHAGGKPKERVTIDSVTITEAD